jgi:hypothetical protein
MKNVDYRRFIPTNAFGVLVYAARHKKTAIADAAAEYCIGTSDYAAVTYLPQDYLVAWVS